MIKPDNITKLKVEVTSYCNAACPGCVRNDFGGKTVDWLNLSHMSMDTWDKILESTATLNILTLDLNGSVGDFSMHPRILDMLSKFIKQHPSAHIQTETNGGARSAAFWHDLGYLLKDTSCNISFAIDGISNEMNHVHRRNVSFDLALRNAKALRSGGTSPSWMYTLFDHTMNFKNEAKSLAIEHGFTRISFRHSCIPQEDMIVKTDTEDYTVGTQHIHTQTSEHVPLDQNKLKDEPVMLTEVNQYTGPCKAQQDSSIMIDYRGNVFACSYLYSPNTRLNDGTLVVANLDGTWESYPANDFNIDHNTLAEILNHNFFTQLDENIDKETYKMCAKTCTRENNTPFITTDIHL